MDNQYKQYLEDQSRAWLDLDLKKHRRRTLKNPLHRPKDWIHKPPGYYELKLMRNPWYLSFACKILLNIELLPEQAVVLYKMWTRPFPMFVASRGFGKSWLMAVYCMLRMILTPSALSGGAGCKIVIVGAAFRQSKVIFEYMETLWRNAPIYRDLVDSESGPRKDTDRCTMRVNENWTIAVPLGDGSKIRGLRATIIIADEFGSIPPSIYETVVQGFAAVSADPIDNVKAFASREHRKRVGTWTEIQETDFQTKHGNQIIISGTADYDFKHYADYWKRYCAFVRAENNATALREQGFTVDEMGEHFHSSDYCVIRIPYKLIPQGFMDDKVVARARATVHSGIYQMEYGACECKNTSITTNNGVKFIQNVQLGDLVLTHQGRFRPVTKRTYRHYVGKIYQYKTFGYSKQIGITVDHPFWYGNNLFEPLKEQTCLTNLNELANINILNIEDVCTNYLETLDEKYIYPQSSQSKINLEQQRYIRQGSRTQVSLSKEFGIGQTAISYIENDNRKPKTSIIKTVSLDYNFGLIIGYYAAEGSVGADGRQVSFALDEHKDTEYQKQLLQAIQKVFGFQGKRYVKKKNTVEICVNSRLVAEIMKHICPGISHDKLIKHNIMFANEECLKGIIEGYWNGDGYISYDKDCSDAHCINQSLLNQIRIGLSYFEISSSLLDKADGTVSLTMSGNNHRKFLAEFYKKIHIDIGCGFIRNINNMTILPILEKEEIDYDGLVYNLEVEEDSSYSTLNATTHNCFTADSDGFFKRSLIESCVAVEKNINSGHFPVWCNQPYNTMTRGNPTAQYAYGIDPASEADNFSIVVLEIHPEHQRVVYCWTTNRGDFKKRQRAGLTETADFYGFCARKIRDLMVVFPPAIGHPKGASIGMDAQGGGIAVMEALHDPDKIHPGEISLWPIIDPDKEKDTDDLPGSHIVDLVQFAKFDWTSEANHGLRKDMEDKVLLFPQFDPVTLELSAIDDGERVDAFRKKHGKELTIYDSLEDAVLEIEELKNELTTIVMTRTGTGTQGRDRWDTPEVKTETGRKGHLRKDRYSALVIANMVARQIQRRLPVIEYEAIGGFVGQMGPPKEGERMYNGPEWFTKGTDTFSGFAVRKK